MKQGDTLTSIARAFGVTVAQPARVEQYRRPESYSRWSSINCKCSIVR
nr:LysM domain-containing protein [Bacillus subtilis]